MAKIDFATGYNRDSDAVSRETAFANVDEFGEIIPSMTKQSFAEEVDINTIVRRFGITGEAPLMPPPSSVEFDQVYDFQSAMNVIRAGEESFMTLDAATRARFNNSAGEFLSFVHDDANRAQAELWGLVPPRPVPAPAVIAEGDAKPLAGVPGQP